VIAKRRKPRPTGPPPARSPKRERDEVAGTTSSAKRKSNEPVPPSAAGVLKRAGFIAGAYVLVLIFILKATVALAVIIGLIGFGFMVGLGLLIERWRYRNALRKWESSRAGGK
jgi:hypothetical protein